MTEITEEAVLTALRSVTDPDAGQDVVSLGIISGLAVKGGHVTFVLEVPAEQGQAKEPLRKACEQAVDALPGVLSTSAVLTAHRGTETAETPAQAAPDGPSVAPKPLVEGIRSMVAVASGKGGVGKSTTAVNLALGLVKRGLTVGLMDADVFGPNLPRMLGLTGRPNSPDGRKIEPMAAYGLVCMSMGLLVPDDTPMIWRGPMVMSAIEQLLRDVLWGELDVLVIDLPPGTGDAQLTLAQRVPLTGAVIVSTPQDIALLDVRKGIAMFNKVDVPVLGIVENMSYFLCPHCGERSEVFSHGGAQRTAGELGIEFLGEIPLDLVIRETSDAGLPIVATQPESPQAATYMGIAVRVAEKIEEALGEEARTAPSIVVQ